MDVLLNCPDDKRLRRRSVSVGGFLQTGIFVVYFSPSLSWEITIPQCKLQGFPVKEGLSCVFSMVKQHRKAQNLALPWLENPVLSCRLVLVAAGHQRSFMQPLKRDLTRRYAMRYEISLKIHLSEEVVWSVSLPFYPRCRTLRNGGSGEDRGEKAIAFRYRKRQLLFCSFQEHLHNILVIHTCLLFW